MLWDFSTEIHDILIRLATISLETDLVYHTLTLATLILLSADHTDSILKNDILSILKSRKVSEEGLIELS